MGTVIAIGVTYVIGLMSGVVLTALCSAGKDVDDFDYNREEDE